jgi:hypothetical protein
MKSEMKSDAKADGDTMEAPGDKMKSTVANPAPPTPANADTMKKDNKGQ